MCHKDSLSSRPAQRHKRSPPYMRRPGARVAFHFRAQYLQDSGTRLIASSDARVQRQLFLPRAAPIASPPSSHLRISNTFRSYAWVRGHRGARSSIRDRGAVAETGVAKSGRVRPTIQPIGGGPLLRQDRPAVPRYATTVVSSRRNALFRGWRWWHPPAEFNGSGPCGFLNGCSRPCRNGRAGSSGSGVEKGLPELWRGSAIHSPSTAVHS